MLVRGCWLLRSRPLLASVTRFSAPCSIDASSTGIKLCTGATTTEIKWHEVQRVLLRTIPLPDNDDDDDDDDDDRDPQRDIFLVLEGELGTYEVPHCAAGFHHTLFGGLRRLEPFDYAAVTASLKSASPVPQEALCWQREGGTVHERIPRAPCSWPGAVA